MQVSPLEPERIMTVSTTLHLRARTGPHSDAGQHVVRVPRAAASTGPES